MHSGRWQSREGRRVINRRTCTPQTLLELRIDLIAARVVPGRCFFRDSALVLPGQGPLRASGANGGETHSLFDIQMVLREARLTEEGWCISKVRGPA